MGDFPHVYSISLKNINAYDSTLNAIAVTPIDAALTIEAAKYLLAQNYPNPFNPTTTINFTVPAGNVKIDIYNVLGQKVKVLVDSKMAAGTYDVVWDGTNALGEKVASGIYFYKLKSEVGSKIMKMLLNK